MASGRESSEFREPWCWGILLRACGTSKIRPAARIVNTMTCRIPAALAVMLLLSTTSVIFPPTLAACGNRMSLFASEENTAALKGQDSSQGTDGGAISKMDGGAEEDETVSAPTEEQLTITSEGSPPVLQADELAPHDAKGQQSQGAPPSANADVLQDEAEEEGNEEQVKTASPALRRALGMTNHNNEELQQQHQDPSSSEEIRAPDTRQNHRRAVDPGRSAGVGKRNGRIKVPTKKPRELEVYSADTEIGASDESPRADDKSANDDDLRSFGKVDEGIVEDRKQGFADYDVEEKEEPESEATYAGNTPRQGSSSSVAGTRRNTAPARGAGARASYENDEELPKTIAASPKTAENKWISNQKRERPKTYPGQFPFIAVIRLEGAFHCAGSVISVRFVLTARHCASNPDEDSYTVTVGEHSLSMDEPTAEQRLAVEKIHRHPNEGKLDYSFDFALFELARYIRPTKRVQRIALPKPKTEFSSSDECFVVGWGSTDPERVRNQSASDTLIDAPIRLVSSSACRASYGNRVDRSMVCAGSKSDGMGCVGDSGGPLVCRHANNKMYTLVGLNSWGEARVAPGTYGVFARVTAARRWIKQITKV